MLPRIMFPRVMLPRIMFPRVMLPRVMLARATWWSRNSFRQVVLFRIVFSLKQGKLVQKQQL